MTLDADGTPQRPPVEVGLVTSTTAEIKSGLAEGTAVVTGTAADLIGTRRPGRRRVRRAVASSIPGDGPGGDVATSSTDGRTSKP